MLGLKSEAGRHLEDPTGTQLCSIPLHVSTLKCINCANPVSIMDSCAGVGSGGVAGGRGGDDGGGCGAAASRSSGSATSNDTACIWCRSGGAGRWQTFTTCPTTKWQATEGSFRAGGSEAPAEAPAEAHSCCWQEGACLLLCLRRPAGTSSSSYPQPGGPPFLPCSLMPMNSCEI